MDEFTYMAVEVDAQFVTAGASFLEVLDEAIRYWTHSEIIGEHDLNDGEPCRNPECVEEGLRHQLTHVTLYGPLEDLRCPMYWDGADSVRLRFDWWDLHDEEIDDEDEDPDDSIYIMRRNARPELRPEEVPSRNAVIDLGIAGDVEAGFYAALSIRRPCVRRKRRNGS